MYQSILKLLICHLHISHSASCLPPKLCIKVVINFFWVLQWCREKSKDNSYSKFGRGGKQASVSGEMCKNKKDRRCMLIDIAVPSESNTSAKFRKKLSNYQDLENELKSIRVCTGHGKPGKSWNLRISFSRPGRSWDF